MDDIKIIQHSLAHILAAAVLDMFPEAKLAVGPAIENGFYYDFELPRTLIPEDLPILEKKMREIINKDMPFEKVEIPVSGAIERLSGTDKTYKLELVKELEKEGEKKVTLYKTGEFVDLCEGPHVENTSELINIGFKLDKIAGAYWKGSEKNAMLQRIYGLAFETEKELKVFLENREEAEKRNHRKLGTELDLFLLNDEIGGGLPVWLPKGTTLRRIIKTYLIDELIKEGYEMIETPHIAKKELWERSGHLSFYNENMYSSFKVDEQEYLVKPMNCPFHVYAYKSNLRSYKDLPIRYAEFGTVYRYEKSGVLHGLLRVRGFTQDDAHIFCRKDQIEQEIKKAVEFAVKVLNKFGFKDYEIFLSTKPEKAVGSEANWNLATKSLKKALKAKQLEYIEDPGEGIFYGPKIDIKIKDVLGRAWQCTTIQVDFNLPERFNLEYINEKGKKEHPIMIHRALLGSLERFIGVLIEHYGGALPVWLAPVQFRLIPVSQKHIEYVKTVYKKLNEKNPGIRIEIDERNESVSRKIKDAELQKIPYCIVIGEKEKDSESFPIRLNRKGGKIQSMSISEISKLLDG